MFQIDEIKSNAVGLVGWRQSVDSDLPTIDADNLATRSGLIYQEGSGLVTIGNIFSTLETPNLSDAAFNTRLEEIVGNAYVQVLNKLFTEDDFIENDLLFRYPNSWDKVSTLPTAFVGYEIDITNCRNLSMIINKIVLEFNSTEAINVYLFNDQQSDPYVTTAITTATRKAVAEDVNIVLSNYKSNSNIWYIGYLSSEVSGSPYFKNYELANYQTGFMGAYIRPVRVDGATTAVMFNPKDVVYTSETWGINLDISSYYDYTSIANSNERRFAEALQLQVAVNVVNIMANTTRSNRNERLSKASAMFELNGNRINREFPIHLGLIDRLAVELKRLKGTYFGHGLIKGTL